MFMVLCILKISYR